MSSSTSYPIYDPRYYYSTNSSFVPAVEPPKYAEPIKTWSAGQEQKGQEQKGQEQKLFNDNKNFSTPQEINKVEHEIFVIENKTPSSVWKGMLAGFSTFTILEIIRNVFF